MTATAKNDSSPSLTNTVEHLLTAIVSGKYAPGDRLPPERQLAQELGASRSTLREALRQLASLHLLQAKRGSGVVVLPKEEWSFEIVPRYIASGATDTPGGAPAVFLQMLELRQAMLFMMMRLAAPRLGSGDLDPTRELVQKAWDARNDAAAYAEIDLAVVRSVADLAGTYSSLWLFNGLGDVWLDLANRIVLDPALLGDDYVSSWLRTLDALEHQDGEEACRILGAWMSRFDDGVRRLMGLSGP